MTTRMFCDRCGQLIRGNNPAACVYGSKKDPWDILNPDGETSTDLCEKCTKELRYYLMAWWKDARGK